MALPTGTKAPNFTLPTKTADGPKLVTLSEYLGKQPVVLLFVPMAFTGTCTQELCSVSQNIGRYASLDAAVLGISGDNPFAQEAWAQKEGITFPLLSDYEHTVTRAYDVAYESFLPERNLPMGGVAKRAVFVVDREGTIRHAESNDDARVLPDFERVLAGLAALK